MKKDYSYYVILILSVNFLYSLHMFYFPLYFASIGITSTVTGIILSLFTFTGILFSFHAGIASDRFPNRIILYVGVLMASIFLFGLASTVNPFVLGALFIIGGLGSQILKRTTDQYVYTHTDKKKEGSLMGLFEVVRILPIAVAIILGGALLGYLSFTTFYFFSSIIFLLLLLPITCIQSGPTFHSPLISYVNDLKRKEVLVFCSLIFLFTMHWGGEMVSYSPFLLAQFSLTSFQIGMFIGCAILFLVISSYAVGKVFDHFPKPFLLIAIGMIISGFGNLAFTLTDNVLFSFVLRSIHEIGDGMFQVMISIGILHLFGKERMGGNAGFVYLVTLVASGIGAILFGIVAEQYGFALPHQINGIIAMVTGVLLLFCRGLMLKNKV